MAWRSARSEIPCRMLELSVPVAFAGFHQFLFSDREAGDRRTFLTRESPLVSGLTDRYVSFAPGVLPSAAIVLIAEAEY